jgi:hypothetical protein
LDGVWGAHTVFLRVASDMQLKIKNYEFKKVVRGAFVLLFAV